MLSTLSWPSVPLHLGRKAHIKAQQDFLPQMPRTVTVHAQSLGSAASQTFAYTISTSYSYDKSRPSQLQNAQNSVRNSMVHPVPPAAPKPPHATLSANLVAEHTAHALKSEMNNPTFKIYANMKVPNTFIYERSEDARSDTLTSYSSASSDSFASSSTASSTSTISQSNFPPRAIKAAPPPSGQGQPRSNLSQARPISSIGNPTTTLREERRVSVIDAPPSARPDSVVRSVPESAIGFPTGSARDGYSSDSAVMNLGGPRDRTSARPGSSLSAREVTPPRIDEQRLDGPRARRLSGAAFAPPPAIRERYSPDNALGRSESVRSAVPVAHVPATIALRNAPSVDRTHVSPPLDRERLRESPPMLHEQPRHRRLSNASVHVPTMTHPVDRPPLSRGSTGSSMNRERTSPTSPYGPEDIVRGHLRHSPPAEPKHYHERSPDNSGRSFADHRGCPPPSNIIITNGAEMIQPSRSVRFSENLICPSPIPLSKRRKGWFNKRGDQLMTNEGHFCAPEQPFPPDLDEYPDFGVGWMNEEGIRIDMHHRLIPKGPLRPALKRTSTSSSGGSSNSSLRPESRALYLSSHIGAIDE
ncbi:hypothetical protein SCHPADRAFT_577217 [Schizopora paradoxa]|uniref:Uncharacterized protein n=1 Tax=Schizopora paradoxa TaxID=27342 RepID=A0A0H2RCH5_9AGAM|nr:hypothetical protein SCHPADRAFT_577217 [Schizopora paradoxa]